MWRSARGRGAGVSPAVAWASYPARAFTGAGRPGREFWHFQPISPATLPRGDSLRLRYAADKLRSSERIGSHTCTLICTDEKMAVIGADLCHPWPDFDFFTRSAPLRAMTNLSFTPVEATPPACSLVAAALSFGPENADTDMGKCRGTNEGAPKIALHCTRSARLAASQCLRVSVLQSAFTEPWARFPPTTGPVPWPSGPCWSTGRMPVAPRAPMTRFPASVTALAFFVGRIPRDRPA